MLACSIYDPIVAKMQRDREQANREQWARKHAKSLGGSWKCQGIDCRRTISANKDLCAECAEKKEQAQAA